MKLFKGLLAIALVSLIAVSCKETKKGAAEDIDNAVETVDEAASDAVEATKDAASDAVDAAGEVVDSVKAKS